MVSSSSSEVRTSSHSDDDRGVVQDRVSKKRKVEQSSLQNMRDSLMDTVHLLYSKAKELEG